MQRLRIPIVGLVAIVAVIALDLAVLRALFRGPDSMSSNYGYLVPIDSTHALPFATLALGVLPMSSILVIAAILQLIRISRTNTISRFWIGFEVFGWLAILLFMSLSALSPAAVQRFLLITASPFQPVFDAIIARQPPEWVFDGIELTHAVVFFLLPELLLALVGGWRVGKLPFSTVSPEARTASCDLLEETTKALIDPISPICLR